MNRAPVMTLWASVVAERIGHDRDTSFTLGKVVAGLNAQSKAKQLGMIDPDMPKADRRPDGGRRDTVRLLGRSVPVVETDGAVRAVAGDRPVTPAGVEGYLCRSFGESLERVRAAMETLAASRRPDRLAAEAYDLYERFRPSVPAGRRGWGVKGELDLTVIRSLASA